MCEEFKTRPQKFDGKTFLTLQKECGNPYPELSLKENYKKKSAVVLKEYIINKNALGMYEDEPKNYYPSYFIETFNRLYTPFQNRLECKSRKKPSLPSLVDLNLKKTSKDCKKINDELDESKNGEKDYYPSTNPIKYHPLTSIPTPQKPEGFLTSWTKYFLGSEVETELESSLQFSKPSLIRIKNLFTEKPIKLFERRQKSLLIRQELKINKEASDLCIKEVKFGHLKFDRVKTINSQQIVDIHTMIDDALNRSFMPNGRYSSGAIVCKDFILHIQEKTNATLASISSQLSFMEKEVILCQLLLTLTILQGQYGILLNNIGPDGIGIINLKEEKGFFKYVIAGRTFYLPNIGYLAMFTDFERAIVLNPMYTDKPYRGIRNLKITCDVEPFWGNKAGHELKTESFKTKYLPILDDDYNYKTYKYNDEDQNIFIEGFDSKPDILVDLGDMRTFPAFDFKTDVEDLLRIFLNDDYVFDDLKAVLPDLTAAVLFPRFSKIKFDVIEEFRWP